MDYPTYRRNIKQWIRKKKKEKNRNEKSIIFQKRFHFSSLTKLKTEKVVNDRNTWSAYNQIKTFLSWWHLMGISWKFERSIPSFCYCRIIDIEIWEKARKRREKRYLLLSFELHFFFLLPLIRCQYFIYFFFLFKISRHW